MTAAFQPRTNGPAHWGQSRFFASPSRTQRHGPRHRHSRPANRRADRKTAPGIFLAPAPKTHRETPSQSLGTYQESTTYVFVFASGCAVAPNSANPKYDPTSWNDGGSRNDGVTIQGNSNCYAYATNQKGPFNGGFGMQPGDASGNPITSADDISVDGIRSRAIADGLSPTPVDGGYPVVFVVDPGVDYHWYRQDDNGLWSSKPGSTPVNNVDASGNLITDPATANRNYGPNGPNYSQYGGTLWVPPNFKFPPPYGGG